MLLFKKGNTTNKDTHQNKKEKEKRRPDATKTLSHHVAAACFTALQVFVSHAWLEGVFELGDLLGRAWPRSGHLSNLRPGEMGVA